MNPSNRPNVRALQDRDKNLAAMLKLFCLRASQTFDHVLAGRMLMIDAADMLADAACASGLTAAVGDDAIQKMLAAAFASASAECDKHNRRKSHDGEAREQGEGQR